MSKTNSTEPKQPDFLEELLKNGKTILKAGTREELSEMVSAIPADIKYGAGAVGRERETGMYTLRLDTI